MNLNDIYTAVIAEHNASGRNKRNIDKPDLMLEGLNPSCGDEIEIAVKLSGDLIEDIAFSGSGCAISQASASILADLARGKTVREVQTLISLFLKMIKSEITDDTHLAALGEAIVLKNISRLPARVKCAVLAWHTLGQILKQVNESTKEI